MRNCFFLVYRRLRLDVAAFPQTMRAEAERLKQQPGFEDIDYLAALLVGRWPSGVPLSRDPKTDNPALGDVNNKALDMNCNPRFSESLVLGAVHGNGPMRTVAQL